MDIKLKDFEGPLDLLLHLVSKYEMDIYDVPIVEVIEQYLAFIATLQSMRLEVAGDYMVMASQLMLIKSRKLLPKVVEPFVQEDDPELTLLTQLEEYKTYKELSGEIADQHAWRTQFFAKPKEELIYDDMVLNHDKTTLDIFLAFSMIMSAKQESIKHDHTVIEREDYKIEDMMTRVEEALTINKQLPLSELFASSHSLTEMITLFLATLELIKVHKVFAYQAETFGEILLEGEPR